MNRLLSAYLPPVAWMVMIYVVSSQPILPGASVAWLDFVLKKSGHMFAYAILFFFWFRAVNLGEKKQNILLPLVLTFCYAAIDEFHQSFVPGRTGTARDVAYDSLGMFVMMLRIKRLI